MANSDGLYFDPSTGKLSPHKVIGYNSINMDIRGADGFFGGTLAATLAESSNRDHTSKDFQEAAIATTDYAEANLAKFYKIQSLQMLGEESDRVMVPIWIARDRGDLMYMNVAPAWIGHIQQAINDINYAAPGLCLYITSVPSRARIKIAGTAKKSCYTMGNILQTTSSEIYLYHEWSEMKRTSCHEILHAIGFQHEHQRRDRELSIHVEKEGLQYQMKNELLGLTRFDPFSIMLYPEDEELSRSRGDPVWFTKPFIELNREMSELDKVALNNLYHPCKGSHYSPTKYGKGVTGLWYCGRLVNLEHLNFD